MLITLKNEALSLTVATLGAQMISILGADGCEYLWQGDPKFWPDRAPNLFPFIGRLWGGSYTFHGIPYAMGIHGFAAQSEFSPAERSETHVALALRSNAATLAAYPFDFTLRITYQLRGNAIEISFRVENHSGEAMPFGIGGHPGFRVPLENGERFEDYEVVFSQPCQPDRVGFTPAVYLSGHDTPYPLENNRVLPLKHDLFDDDAVILKNMARKVTLRSKISGRSVTVSYPDMPYLGLWHWPKTDAPYLCIEPWSSLPGRQDIVEEFSCRSDLIRLHPGKIYENTWSITISQEEKAHD